jgi:glutamate-1-semialdehyde 2,1-aminomutase
VEVSYDSGPSNWGDAAAPARNAYTRGTPPGVLVDTVVLPFNQLEATLRLLEANASDLAAVVLDPLPSRVGLVPGTSDYLQGVQAACRRLGILLIVDEIICFRLHPKGAQTLFGLEPDFTTLGKIIGGGQPVGAVAGTREAMAVFDASLGRPVVPHGGTFSANPITMAAGLASLRLMDANAYKHLDDLGEALRARMRAAITAAGVPAQVTGVGSLFRLHLHDRPISTYRDAYPTGEESARQAAVFGFLLAHGILTTPNISGALSTPMGNAEVEEFGAVLEAGLRATA